MVGSFLNQLVKLSGVIIFLHPVYGGDISPDAGRYDKRRRRDFSENIVILGATAESEIYTSSNVQDIIINAPSISAEGALESADALVVQHVSPHKINFEFISPNLLCTFASYITLDDYSNYTLTSKTIRQNTQTDFIRSSLRWDKSYSIESARLMLMQLFSCGDKKFPSLVLQLNKNSIWDFRSIFYFSHLLCILPTEILLEMRLTQEDGQNYDNFLGCLIGAAPFSPHAKFILGEIYKDGLLSFPASPEIAFAYFASSAESGLVLGLLQMGCIYRFGLFGEAIDEEKSLYFYKRALSKKDAGAQFLMANFYRDGLLTLQKNEPLALELYHLSAAQGYPPAYTALGYAYVNETLGLEMDSKKGVEYFRKAASLGEAEAQYTMAILYTYGINAVEKDPVMALELYKKSAAQNFPNALNDLATIYEHGRLGVEINLPRALELYTAAANLGVSDSQYNLATAYERGELGLDRNLPRALQFYQLAAAQNYPEALYRLGKAYLNDELGLTRDRIQAFRLFEKAGEVGYANAYTKIAIAFERDEFISQLGHDTTAEALRYYDLAIKNNDPEALVRIAYAYQYGDLGLNINNFEALRLYHLAADQDFPSAMVSLGIVYEHGELGVPIDLEIALGFYQRGALTGNEFATAALQRLAADSA